jgi:hypothetical protein
MKIKVYDDYGAHSDYGVTPISEGLWPPGTVSGEVSQEEYDKALKNQILGVNLAMGLTVNSHAKLVDAVNPIVEGSLRMSTGGYKDWRLVGCDSAVGLLNTNCLRKEAEELGVEVPEPRRSRTETCHVVEPILAINPASVEAGEVLVEKYWGFFQKMLEEKDGGSDPLARELDGLMPRSPHLSPSGVMARWIRCLDVWFRIMSGDGRRDEAVAYTNRFLVDGCTGDYRIVADFSCNMVDALEERGFLYSTALGLSRGEVIEINEWFHGEFVDDWGLQPSEVDVEDVYEEEEYDDAEDYYSTPWSWLVPHDCMELAAKLMVKGWPLVVPAWWDGGCIAQANGALPRMCTGQVTDVLPKQMVGYRKNPWVVLEIQRYACTNDHWVGGGGGGSNSNSVVYGYPPQWMEVYRKALQRLDELECPKYPKEARRIAVGACASLPWVLDIGGTPQVGFLRGRVWEPSPVEFKNSTMRADKWETGPVSNLTCPRCSAKYPRVQVATWDGRPVPGVVKCTSCGIRHKSGAKWGWLHSVW